MSTMEKHEIDARELSEIAPLDDETSELTSVEFDESMLDGTAIKPPIVENIYCYIGYGIDILDADEPSVKNLQGNWLKSEAFDNIVEAAGNTKGFEVSNMVFTGESVFEVSSSLNIEAGLDVKTPFFSGGLEVKYGNGKSQTKTTRYANVSTMVDLCKFNITGKYIIDPKRLIDSYIDKDVLADINNASVSPGALFRVYGTHMITEHTSGARANFYYTYRGDKDVSSREFEASISAGNAYFTASGKVSMKSEEKAVTENCNLKITAIGGDATAVISTDLATAAAGFLKWATSINEKTATLSNIQSALPIWMLASSESRREEIKKAFETNVRVKTVALDSVYRRPKADNKPIESGVTYKIKNLHSMKSIDIVDWHRDVKAVGLWDTIVADNQQWKATEGVSAKEGYFEFKNTYSGMVLDLYGGSDFKQLFQYKSNGLDNQFFKVVPNKDKYGSVSLYCKYKESYKIAAWGKNHVNGVAIGIVPASDNGDETKWILEPVN